MLLFQNVDGLNDKELYFLSYSQEQNVKIVRKIVSKVPLS